MVSIETDMEVPEQIDRLHVSVLLRGESVRELDYTLKDGNASRLPATLAIAANDDPGAPVTVRVAAGKTDDKNVISWRTFREATVNVPMDRIGLLRMPIQWLCSGQVRTNTTSSEERVATSSCGAGLSCRAGTCADNVIDATKTPLPTFTPELVFGGGQEAEQGVCFNTVACMAQGQIAEPDANCTIARPKNSDDENLNVAVRTVNEGFCDPTNQLCFVPLDGFSNEGFSEANGDRLQLPSAVCTKLNTGAARAIYTSTACTTKKDANPPCAFISSVPSDKAIMPANPSVITPVKLATLPLEGGSAPCCPLTQDGTTLYTCTCDAKDRTQAALYSITPGAAGSEPKLLATIHPWATRGLESDFFSAVATQGALYWSADTNLLRLPLMEGAGENVISIGANVYQATSLLADDSGIYALGNVTGEASSSLKIIVVGYDGTVTRRLDIAAGSPLAQFDQDDAALYLALLQAPADPAVPDNKLWKVVRIPKDGSASAAALPDRPITISDSEQKTGGGYLGLQVDGAKLYTLFEEAPGSDGRAQVTLARSDTAAAAGAPEVLYAFTVNFQLTSVRLLGVIDGVPVLLRTEFVPTSGAQTRSNTIQRSSLLGVTTAGARIIADFSNDTPVWTAGLASDATHIYWLNQTGQIFGYQRNALP